MNAILGFIALLLAAQPLATDPTGRISQQDFKALVAAGNVVIVDTRNADTYRIGHIPGAVLLPLEGLPSWPPDYEKTVAMLKASKKPIVTYCAWTAEATSARAALMLRDRGVPNVRALRGGWNDWVNGNNPIESGLKQK